MMTRLKISATALDWKVRDISHATTRFRHFISVRLRQPVSGTFHALSKHLRKSDYSVANCTSSLPPLDELDALWKTLDE